MTSIVYPMLPVLPRLTWTAVLDIVLVAIVIYQFIQIVRGRRAAHMLGGLAVLAAVYLAALALKMELLRSLMATLAPYSAFALIVMFQSEIRRLLARLGRHRIGFGTRLQRRETLEEILLALQQLSQQSIGALIVVEREIGLRTFVESGVPLDAAISRDLLLAVFHPGAAMHDGAVIVQGDRIAAAACFLPLTMNPELSRYLGTRHRAAIGVTEETDCISLIVSEETGRISIAQFGEIEYDVSLERVEAELTKRRSRPTVRPSATAVKVAAEKRA